MKYLIRVDYSCEEVRTGGKWFEVERDQEPRVGDATFPEGPLLPHHSCRRDEYSQDCMDNKDCPMQVILYVLPYSRIAARILNIRNLEKKCQAS